MHLIPNSWSLNDVHLVTTPFGLSVERPEPLLVMGRESLWVSEGNSQAQERRKRPQIPPVALKFQKGVKMHLCQQELVGSHWGKLKDANAGDIRDTGSVPGSGRSPGGGHGNALQCSCLENPRDGGAWWAAIYGVAQSRTCPDPSSKATLWVKAQHEGALPPPCIVRKDPRVLKLRLQYFGHLI